MCYRPKLHAFIIVSSIVTLSSGNALICHPQTQVKLPEDSIKCVEFATIPSEAHSIFCASIDRARHGYISPSSTTSKRRPSEKLPSAAKNESLLTKDLESTLDEQSSDCMETPDKKWLCYCNPKKTDCNSIEWLQNHTEAISQCQEKWYSSLKYHTTGSPYWIKFMNSNPEDAKDVEAPYYGGGFKPLASHPTPSHLFTPQRQEFIYNISSLELVLVCLFTFAYVIVTAIWNVLATREMFNANA